MPFIKRNVQGNIIALSQVGSDDCREKIEQDDPELLRFLASFNQTKESLDQTDLDFVRVVEDLVEVLVSKNYLMFTDLPEKAQEKMRKRKTLRGKLNSHLDLLGEDETGFF